MSNVYTDWVVKAFLNSMRSYQKTQVPSDFFGQVDAVDKLLKDDRSAMIRTLYNFMVNAGTVDYKFETGSIKLNDRLDVWKKDINKNIGIDIPSGLRALSEQYFRERWRSSFLILNIQYEHVDGWWLPAKMWFLDGGQVDVTGKTDKLGGYEYRIGRRTKGPKIVDIKTKKYLIRKPYNMWYEQWPTPYLVGSGALFHGLSKTLILDKQNDLMAEVIPLMFLSKLGNDLTQKEGDLPTGLELKEHEKKIKEMQEAYKSGTTGGFIAGTFPHDVDFTQTVPQIKEFMNEIILKPSDKNILSAMGMIEMEGFAKSRQETILNPKVMVQEVVDAVLDWRDMLAEVAEDTFEMNKVKHTKDANRAVRVVPGLIRAFLTNDDKVLIRSAFDRGSVGHEDFVSILPFDWKTTMERRIAERDDGLDEKLYPHIIMNQEQHPDDLDVNPESNKENAPEKKKTEKDVDTAEIEDIKKLPRIQSIIYGTIDDLPKDIKASLSIPEQIKYVRNSNRIKSKGLVDSKISFLIDKVINEEKGNTDA